MKPYNTIKTDRLSNGIAQITLNRPEVRNAFNEELIADLTHYFSGPALDPSIRVLVLRGTGKTFCAGGDLNWMKRSAALSLDENLKDTAALTKMFQLMNEFPKPLIGMVHGAAIGGGVGLVSVCDLVVATETTVFSLSEVRLGIVPACIGPFVISKIGASHARELFVSAERFEAKKAKSIGLIHHVVTDDLGLEKKVQEIASTILECSPNAVQLAKKLVLDLSWPERRKSMPDCYAYASQVLAQARVSSEGQEGVKAFLEKRKPSWVK